MIKRLLFFSGKVLLVLMLINGGSSFAQDKNLLNNNAINQAALPQGEEYENLLAHFNAALEKVKVQVCASDNDFETFQRFNRNYLNAEETKLYGDVANGKVNNGNVGEYEKSLIVSFTDLYKKFQKIEIDYPSSVAEFRYEPRVDSINHVCNNACDNPDFSGGTLNGWYCAYAKYNSGCCSFNIVSVTGSIAGAVTSAGGPDPLDGYNDYQETITNVGNDAFLLTCNPSVTMPMVSPYGPSSHAMLLGDGANKVNQGVGICSHTFKVTPANVNFTYQYAVVLQNPGHPHFDQPFFNAAVLDSAGDTIPNCGKYLVTSGFGTKAFGWDSTTGAGTKIYYKQWTSVFTSLKNYVGHCVTVSFEVADCSQGGHFGYAYITTSCAPEGVISSSPAFCGQKTISLTGPPGGQHYLWSDTMSGIVGYDTLQTVTVDSAGKYRLIITPVTGAACNDTIFINIPKAPGPPPHPSFKADTACAGQKVQFTNLSIPLIGPSVKFYWDFYNIGQINDSTTNPVWTFNSPGTYMVKLSETNNGCGYDTIIPIKVDSTVAGGFTNNTACVNNAVNFTNTTVGATKYFWNFGKVTDGVTDTSSLKNPSHTYDSIGTYTVTMIAKNGGPCPDTLKQIISVLSVPTPTITGNDSICLGTSTTLTASGPGIIAYSWSPAGFVNCPTCASVIATPTTTTTFTCSTTNGFCPGDSTFTVYVKPLPTATVTVKPLSDTICTGDSATLKVIAGCPNATYSWTGPISTKDSIRVSPPANNTYFVKVTCNGCTATFNKPIFVVGSGVAKITGIDSICTGDSTTWVASGGTNYKWLPPLLTNSPMVYVKNNTTYACVISSYCGTDTIKKTLHLVPITKIGFTGDTAICVGNNGTFTASGGGSYTWNPPASGLSCYNCPNPVASPTVSTTYTLTVSNGKCPHDTIIHLSVNKPNDSISNFGWICKGGVVTINAYGGGTYQWSNGATTSSIQVSANSDTTYKVSIMSKGCPITDSLNLRVDSPFLNTSGNDTIRLGDTAHLHVNGAQGYVWIPATGLSCVNCPNPVADPSVTTTYTITSTDSVGCPTSRTLTVFVETPCSDFNVPNVFTPNDDGINDDFVVSVLNPSSYSIVVYDRWGKQMYTSTDATVYWNGRINGSQNLAPDGTYYYIIKASCQSNNYVKKGFVQLIGIKK